MSPSLLLLQATDGAASLPERIWAWLDTFAAVGEVGERTGFGAWIDTGKLPTLVAILAFGWLMYIYQKRAKAGHEIPIRRIAGLDAMDEAIGRATEMGRPVLYVPGIDEIKEIQTIYSMMILRHVARKTAEYGTELIVPVRDSIVMTFAEEAVRGGCLDAGRPDAFVKDNIRYLSNEQFAYCAGVAGIMTREKPAANILLGMFFAESLILAETGFLSGAIQVAGTAKQHQLPFFVAACDYTIMGEEYFAVTAYLTREPNLMGTIRAGDVLKIFIVSTLLLGVLLATLAALDQATGIADGHTWADVLRRLGGLADGGGG
ncbi:MAG: DUF6754 domain-containing protein [Planctomycetota bacterium]